MARAITADCFRLSAPPSNAIPVIFISLASGISQVLCALSGHAQPSGALSCWLLQGKGMLLGTQLDKPGDVRACGSLSLPQQNVSAFLLCYRTPHWKPVSKQYINEGSQEAEILFSSRGGADRSDSSALQAQPANAACVLASAGRSGALPARSCAPPGTAASARDRLSSSLAHFAAAPKYLRTCFTNPVSEFTSVRAASLHQQEDNLLHAEPKQQPTEGTLSQLPAMIIVYKAALVIQKCCLDANTSAHRDPRRSGITSKTQSIFINHKMSRREKPRHVMKWQEFL